MCAGPHGFVLLKKPCSGAAWRVHGNEQQGRHSGLPPGYQTWVLSARATAATFSSRSANSAGVHQATAAEPECTGPSANGSGSNGSGSGRGSGGSGSHARGKLAAQRPGNAPGLGWSEQVNAWEGSSSDGDGRGKSTAQSSNDDGLARGAYTAVAPWTCGCPNNALCGAGNILQQPTEAADAPWKTRSLKMAAPVLQSAQSASHRPLKLATAPTDKQDAAEDGKRLQPGAPAALAAASGKSKEMECMRAADRGPALSSGSDALRVSIAPAQKKDDEAAAAAAAYRLLRNSFSDSGSGEKASPADMSPSISTELSDSSSCREADDNASQRGCLTRLKHGSPGSSRSSSGGSFGGGSGLNQLPSSAGASQHLSSKGRQRPSGSSGFLTPTNASREGVCSGSAMESCSADPVHWARPAAASTAKISLPLAAACSPSLLPGPAAVTVAGFEPSQPSAASAWRDAQLLRNAQKAALLAEDADDAAAAGEPAPLSCWGGVAVATCAKFGGRRGRARALPMPDGSTVLQDTLLEFM